MVFVVLAGAASGGSIAWAVESVRVDSTAGVPRLMVDCRPVRARMFWGAPGSQPIRVGSAAQEVAFEFTPVEDELGGATMHFRFGQVAGELDIDAIQVRDLTTGDEVIPLDDFEQGMDGFRRSWTFWPPGAANTVATLRTMPGQGRAGTSALRVSLRAPAGGQWPDFHIYHLPRLTLHADHRYRVSFLAKAEPPRELTVAFYRPGQTFTYLGGPPSPFEGQIKMAAEAGVDFVSFPIHLPWPRPDEPTDWRSVEAQCRAVLTANPRAMLLPRIGMEPPRWWSEAHAEEMMAWDEAGPEQYGAVVASPVYRRDACERLARLIQHLEATFGEHIAGYHPCGQNTGEWFYQQTWARPLNGYAPADLRAWRQWLKQRYRDDGALRTAWHDAQVSLETVPVPTPAQRRAAPQGVFHDPVAGRALIDFALFQQEAMAECVCQLAKVTREATRGRKLVVFFYGYVFEFGAIHNGPATAGHYGLRRVLNSPDVDVLCSPISYFDRGLGQSAPAMTAAESVALAGKMWLYEDDTRTYLGSGNFPGAMDAVDTIEDTNRELLRNTAQCALRNFGTWWMDLGATGWFHDARMWGEMKRLQRLDGPLLANPRPFQPEVAAVIDERSMLQVAAGGDVLARPGIYEVRRPLGRVGAPYGQYLQDDVLAGRVSAKLFVFLNAWSLSAAQRQQLLETTRNCTRIWCYAPGYQDENGITLPGMKELTGFQLRPVSTTKAWAEPTAIGRQLGLTAGWGIDQPLRPLFAAADATPDETLAVWPDGSAAVALRRTGEGWSLFAGPPGLNSQLLRLAARRARVHLFSESDCNVYHNGPYLVVHTSQDGPQTINVGRPIPVLDLLSGQKLGQGPQLTLPLQKGDTRVLLLGEP
jgi:hypothetical protein